MPVFVRSDAGQGHTSEHRQDAVHHLDMQLAHRARTQNGTKPRKHVAIRFEPHEPSAYVLTVPGMVQRIADDTREFIGHTIFAWTAPFQEPPSVDTFVALANDLVVDEIDPRGFVHQYTPGIAEHAYAERYSLWSKLRSPFIRWEVSRERRAWIRAATDAAEPEEAEPLLDEQFTSVDAERAYRSVYGLGSKLKALSGNVLHRAEQTAEAWKDEEEDLIAQAEQSWGVPVLVPKLDVFRVMVGFFALLFVVSLPAGAVSLSRSFGVSVRQITSEGQGALHEVRLAVNAEGSGQVAAWDRAAQRFQSAEQSLQNANILAVGLAQAIPQTRDLYQSTRSILSAGDKTSQAAKLLTQGLQSALEGGAKYPDERLVAFNHALEEASPLLEDAMRSIGSVKPSVLPVEARSQIEALKGSLAFGQSSLRDLRVMTELLIGAVGHDRPRTYLIIFQNHTELRPTGGFMGSLAEITLDRGEIKKITVPGGGPYDLRDQLIARVTPPQPLQLIASRWEFQDANWFPDFPAAAQKVRWFWSKAGQPTVDGVITVNATLMEKLLAVTGPIPMPEYGKTITAENFLLETQKAVELEYDKQENKPKKFIGDLMPKVLERLKDGSKNQQLALLGLVAESLETKEVQVWLADQDEEALVERFDWSSRLKPSLGDALSIVEANIAGQKTDAVIDEEVAHEATVQEDGTIVDTVTLTRSHRGQKGELFRGANNVEYVRVYVPEGSELLEATGFQPPADALFKKTLPEDPEDADVALAVQQTAKHSSGAVVTREFGRTAFGGWIQLAPGHSAVTTFKYRLPFTAFDIARKISESDGGTGTDRAAYFLLLTSQSGKLNRNIQSHVSYPASWQVAWQHGIAASSSTASLSFAGAWDRDLVAAGLFNLPHASSQESAP